MFGDFEDIEPFPKSPPTPGSKIAESVFYAAFERSVDMDTYAQLWTARHLLDPSQQDLVNGEEVILLARILRDGNLDLESAVVYAESLEDFERMTVGHPSKTETQTVEIAKDDDVDDDAVATVKENDQ